MNKRTKRISVKGLVSKFSTCPCPQTVTKSFDFSFEIFVEAILFFLSFSFPLLSTYARTLLFPVWTTAVVLRNSVPNILFCSKAIPGKN